MSLVPTGVHDDGGYDDMAEPDSDELTVDIRGYESTDWNFLVTSWLRSFRRARAATPASLYYPLQTRLINRIVQTANVAVACDLTMREFVMGYAIANARPGKCSSSRPLELHYAFTKLDYRRIGIFKALCKRLGWDGQSPIYVSHWTFDTHSLAKAKSMPLKPCEYLSMELGEDLFETHDPSTPNHRGEFYYSNKLPLGARDPTKIGRASD